MRVLHVYHDFWPMRGGIEDHLADLTRVQASQGIEPIVLCANARPVTHCNHPVSCAAKDRPPPDDVLVIRAASIGRYLTPVCPSWPRWIHALQPDVVHLHLPCPLGEWAVWLSRPQRLIVSLHNDYVRPRLALKLHRRLHRAVLKRASAIIVGAPDYAATSPVLADLQSKVHSVPYGIDLANYAPASSAKQGGEVLYAGRLCYYKGVEVLLDAAPAIRGRITILGNGPWCKRLMQQAQRLRLGERVSFLGQVPEQTLIERMQASRVFVFPSTERSEAFGLAQLKAMACGLPVVSSDLPGVSWLNRCGETGLTVPVRDASALAQAVNRLLADADLREQLSLGARARAKQFTLSTMAQTIGGIYASVA